jgi:hypothetical protein
MPCIAGKAGQRQHVPRQPQGDFTDSPCIGCSIGSILFRRHQHPRRKDSPVTRFALAWASSLLAVSVASAQSGSSWSYFGLPNGPGLRPLASHEISGTPWFWTKPRNPSPVLVYDPPTISLGAAPQPRKLILGWHSYRSPSPRPAPNVDVQP